MPEQVIALDVGGSSVKSGIVSTTRAVTDARHTPVQSDGDAETILNTFAGIVSQHFATIPMGECAGIGFGFPGPFDYEAGVSHIRGLTKFDSIYGADVGAALRQRIPALANIPIRFRNDAEAAIVGEARYGAGRGCHRVIGITLGTGLGSAFLLDGVPQTAGDGIPPRQWLYLEPFNGALADDCFSRRGLEGRLRAVGIHASISDAARHLDEDIAEASVIRQVFVAFGADLARFLYPYAAGFRAEVVVVLGGIARSFEHFRLQPYFSMPIVRGSLDQHAALLGAADLIFERG